MDLPRSGLQVVLVQARSQERAGHGHRVGVAIRLTQAPFVRPRKLLRRGIDHGALDLAGVTGSMIQRSRPLRCESGPALILENIRSWTMTSRITLPSAAS